MTMYKVGHAENFVTVSPNWNILDIGSGGNPCECSTHCVDLYDDDHIEQRRGASLVKDKRFIKGSVEDLSMFPDKFFDYTICSHLLEHVSNPDKACRELIRVSKAGYIETPSKFTEIAVSVPTEPSVHKWYVSLIGNDELLFEPIRVHAPFGKYYQDKYYTDGGYTRRSWVAHKNLTYTFLYWNGSFNCRVV